MSHIQTKDLYWCESFFALQDIKTYFVRRKIKNKKIETLAIKFQEQGEKQGFDKKVAATLFSDFFQPKLRKTQLENIKYLERYILKENSLTLFMQTALAMQDHKKCAETISCQIDRLLFSMEKEAQNVDRILAIFGKGELLFKKLNPFDHYKLLNFFFAKLAITKNDFQVYIERLETFVNKAITTPNFIKFVETCPPDEIENLLIASLNAEGHEILTKAFEAGGKEILRFSKPNSFKKDANLQF